MFRDTAAFASYSIDDPAAAEAFYRDVLGLEVTTDDEMGMRMLTLHLGGGGTVLLYPKDDHQPATHTVLNFRVPSTPDAVAALEAKGVRIESSMLDQPPYAAWCKDPAGNWIQVLQA